MNIITLWTRFFAGMIFCLFAFMMLFVEKNPVAATASLAIAAALVFPPQVTVRGQANLLATDFSLKQIFTAPDIFTTIRWFIGFTYALSALGGFLTKEYEPAISFLLLGLIFISPLDRLVFANLRALKDEQKWQRNGILIARNLAVLLHTIALGNYFQQQPLIANMLLILAFGLLILVACITPAGLIVPRPVASNFSPWSVRFSPVPIAKTNAGAVVISHKQKNEPIKQVVPVAKKQKRKRYTNAYKMGWFATLKITEENFNTWIRNFQTDWLEANEYYERLKMHRQPEAFKKEIVDELIDYLHTIRHRPELKIIPKPTDTGVPDAVFVPDLISKTWKSDKRIRTLYSALVKYSSQRGARKLVFIAHHIAEYRAIFNLAKRIMTSMKIPYTHPLLAQQHELSKPGKIHDEIIDHIIMLGKNLETDKSWRGIQNEDAYRNQLVTLLNSVSKEYVVKAEALNRNGKTDILVCDTRANNLLVVECKIWKGEKYLIEGLDQLLNTYVNWRDKHLALIIFNTSAKKFSEVVENAKSIVARHRYCLTPGEERTETCWSYTFVHPDDNERRIRLELILFNLT